MPLTTPVYTHKRICITGLLLLFVLIGAVYSVITPAFETPDEIWHYAFVHHLVTQRELPVSRPDAEALWQQQGVQAPAYYLAVAVLTGWLDQSDFPDLYARANPHRAIGIPGVAANPNYLIHHADEGWPWRGALLGLHIARLFSVLLGAVTIWATYQTLALLVPHTTAISAAAAVAFIPQFNFISAAASNDNAVNALAALVVWRLTALLLREPSVEPVHPNQNRLYFSYLTDFWYLGLLLGLAVLSKLSALGLVPLTGLVILGLAWRHRRPCILLQALVAIGLPLLTIGGWWYLRNWQLYRDPLAWNVWQANILLRVQPADWRQIGSELVSLERSFWGLFGWLNVAYPERVYLWLRAVESLVAIGLVLSTVRWLFYDRTIKPARLAAQFLFLVWLVILVISWLRFMRIAPAAQGRYFFPAVPALAWLIHLGFDGWRIGALRWLVVVFLFCLSLTTPFWIIGPAYAPPPAQVDSATDLTTLEVQVGHEFALVGIKASQETLLPGQQTQVRIAWRALRTSAQDYSVFIHLVDTDGLIVAQTDTMPGGGRRPTSQWAPGELRVETYPIVLPATAYTPNRARWAVGMYLAAPDSASMHRLPVKLEPSSVPNGGYVSKGDALYFGTVTIATPAGETPNPMHEAFHDNVTLQGYRFSHRVLRQGELFTVTLFWRARGLIEHDYTTFVHLLNEEHQMFGGSDDRPDPPTIQWHTADVIKDVHAFVIPTNTPPGAYQIELGLYTRPDFDRLPLQDAAAQGADRLLIGPLEVRP